MSAVLTAFLTLPSGIRANTLVDEGSVDQAEASATLQWSPDHKILARVESERWFATPEGANSCLYFNAQPIYPGDCMPRPKATYRNIHTFLSPLEWSMDSSKVALVEKIFDWEYFDPFGAYFDGEASSVRYYLVIASIDRTASGYSLKGIGQRQQIHWQSSSQLTLNGQTYDLTVRRPGLIP